MSKLILTRHGQSTWNAENRFTGWVDVDLSEKGKEEAKKSGELISELNIKIDISYTSYLKRAIETLTIILKTLNLSMKFNTAWELNERHYGSLTGLNKEETKKKTRSVCSRICFLVAATRMVWRPSAPRAISRSEGNDIVLFSVLLLVPAGPCLFAMGRVLAFP